MARRWCRNADSRGAHLAASRGGSIWDLRFRRPRSSSAARRNSQTTWVSARSMRLLCTSAVTHRRASRSRSKMHNRLRNASTGCAVAAWLAACRSNVPVATEHDADAVADDASAGVPSLQYAPSVEDLPKTDPGTLFPFTPVAGETTVEHPCSVHVLVSGVSSSWTAFPIGLGGISIGSGF
jgi:hypothetical protein